MEEQLSEINRQRMMVRMNALNRACDLLISEQEIAQSSAKIPIDTIIRTTQELELFIWMAVQQEAQKSLVPSTDGKFATVITSTKPLGLRM